MVSDRTALAFHDVSWMLLISDPKRIISPMILARKRVDRRDWNGPGCAVGEKHIPSGHQVKWCKVCVQAFVCESVCVCVFDVHTYFEIVWWFATWLLYNFRMRMGMVRERTHARFERWVCWWPPKAGVFIFGYLSFTSSTQTLPGRLFFFKMFVLLTSHIVSKYFGGLITFSA